MDSIPQLASEAGRLIRVLMSDMKAVERAEDLKPLDEERIRQIEIFLKALSRFATGQLKVEIEEFRQIVMAGEGKTLEEIFEDGARIFWVSDGVPNPFNPEIIFRYRLAEPGQVEIAVFNTLGQKVRVLCKEHKLAGAYTISWDGRDDAGRQLSSGVYLLRMQVDGVVQTRKMLLVKRDI